MSRIFALKSGVGENVAVKAVNAHHLINAVGLALLLLLSFVIMIKDILALIF